MHAFAFVAVLIVGCAAPVGTPPISTTPAPPATGTPVAQSTSQPTASLTATPSAFQSAPPIETATVSPTQTASPSPTVSLGATPSTSPSSIPTQTATSLWELTQVWDRSFNTVSMAVDPEGSVHAVLSDNRGLVYLTNATGKWTRERFGIPPEGSIKDGGPSIAIDDSGSVAVAFSRAGCSIMGCYGIEIYVARYTSAAWEVPVGIGPGLNPQLAYRHGVFHVAYADFEGDDTACDEFSPVAYATNETGEWIKSRAVRSSENFDLALAADGTPLIAANDQCGLLGETGIHLASRKEDFALEPVPGTKANYDYLDDLATDATGRSHVLYHNYDDILEVSDLFISTRDANGWIEPIELVEDQNPREIAAAADGTIHLASVGVDGVWHWSNASGSFVSDQVSSAPNYPYVPLSLAVATHGRPHILFGVGDGDSQPRELWYAVEPAN